MGGKNPRFFDFPKTPSKTCILALLGGGTPPPPLPPSIQPLLTDFYKNHQNSIKFNFYNPLIILKKHFCVF